MKLCGSWFFVVCQPPLFFGRDGKKLEFHEQHILASTSRIEQCRRKLHAGAVVFAASNMCYFVMVLAGSLRWSVAVLAVVQIPKSITALLVGEMWIYT